MSDTRVVSLPSLRLSLAFLVSLFRSLSLHHPRSFVGRWRRVRAVERTPLCRAQRVGSIAVGRSVGRRPPASVCHMERNRQTASVGQKVRVPLPLPLPLPLPPRLEAQTVTRTHLGGRSVRYTYTTSAPQSLQVLSVRARPVASSLFSLSVLSHLRSLSRPRCWRPVRNHVQSLARRPYPVCSVAVA